MDYRDLQAAYDLMAKHHKITTPMHRWVLALVTADPDITLANLHAAAVMVHRGTTVADVEKALEMWAELVGNG